MRLVLIFLFISTLLCCAQGSGSGRWEGSVKIPERELRLIVDLAQDRGGGLDRIDYHSGNGCERRGSYRHRGHEFRADFCNQERARCSEVQWAFFRKWRFDRRFYASGKRRAVHLGKDRTAASGVP